MPKSKAKTVEEKYQKLTQKEHVLKRPGMYIGATETEIEPIWIFEGDKMVEKTMKYNPGILKLFDEIITNASDHSRTNPVKKIEVKVDQETGAISVLNDGGGIPIEKHKQYGIYVPELIFANFLTGSNYDDTEKRVTGGMNGLGAKLVGTFSKEFNVETVSNGQKYKQTFRDNLDVIEKPKITKVSSSKDYTKITFTPDFKRFGVKKIGDGTFKLLEKRTFDIAACTKRNVSVSFNGAKLGVKDYKEYAKLYIQTETPVFVENDRWQVAIASSPFDSFTQVSFVNGLHTTKGGKHVDHISNQVVRHLVNKHKKKHENINNSMIRENLFVLVIALIENPSFKSQSKEELNTPQAKFGSKCELDAKMLKACERLELNKRALELVAFKASKELKASDGKKVTKLTGIPKLDDANYAGGKRSQDCTLILTEGDSVTGDTPLTLKKISNGQIVIKNIEDLTTEYEFENGKEYGKNSEYEIWTDMGWTKIKHIMKHKTDKKIYRVLSHTGCVDVTEDHSLLDVNSKEIAPKDCKISDKLLHSFPIFKENEVKIPENFKNLNLRTGLWDIAKKLKIRYYQLVKKEKLIELIDDYKNKEKFDLNHKIEITEDEAWVMGFFLADGSCGIYRYKNTDTLNLTWGLPNTDLKLLEKSKNILENIYGNYFSIYKMKTKPSGLTQECSNLKQQYKLCLNGGLKNKYIIDKYRNLLYYKKWKYIHPSILNSDRTIRQQFFDGYYCGDGQHDPEARNKMDVDSKITSQCIYTLCVSLGYETSINHLYEKKPKVYTIGVSRGTLQKDPNVIKKIYKLENIKEQYVYDLETENHHFQAGVGQMIVHNSAKAFAVSGTSVIGRDYYGIFPLKGKLLNVRTATMKQLSSNEEIKNLKTILGLQNKKFKDVKDIRKSMRYGKILCLTDADSDGSHIKGLLLNFFHHFWPQLMETDFFHVLQTPVIKCTKGNKIHVFFNLTEFKDFDTTGWKVKYYKGLGTSTNIEAKESFKDLDKKDSLFKLEDKPDNDAIKLAFEKDLADNRKDWIQDATGRELFLDRKQREVPIRDFINKELVNFSIYDCERSIPNLVDGLKPSQRKVLYSCLKHNIHKEQKVVELCGEVMKTSNYHHGDKSLNDTIISMAQNFVGSNNINFLVPQGQFGTRDMGGIDAASPRYISTFLNPITRNMFHKEDDPLLKLLDDDGKLVEPEYFFPTICTLLVNGSTGIGTGYSTSIPPHNPMDIVKHLRNLIKNPDYMFDLEPWVRGFKGTIEKKETGNTNNWLSRGVYKRIDRWNVEITELPVGTWTTKYKEHLDKLLEAGTINDFKNKGDDSKVHFLITIDPKQMTDLVENDKVYEFFKLESTIKSSNLTFFNEKRKLVQVKTTEEILVDFYKVRLKLYKKRYRHLVNSYEKELSKISAKILYIERVMDGKIKLFRQAVDFVIQQLKEQNFPLVDKSFDYLLNLRSVSFTKEKIEELMKEKENLMDKLNELKSKSASDLWFEDLKEFETNYKKLFK